MSQDKKEGEKQSAPQPEDKYAPVKLVAVELEKVRTQRTLEKV